MVRILAINDLCTKGKVEFRAKTLPGGLAKLIALSQAVPEKTDAARKEATPSFLQRVGESGVGNLDRRRGHAQLHGRERGGLAEVGAWPGAVSLVGHPHGHPADAGRRLWASWP